MANQALIDFDWRAIRIADVRPDGFVAFDYFVGNPDVYVEMLMSAEAFSDFCQSQGIEPAVDSSDSSPATGLGFTLRQATRQDTRSAPIAVGTGISPSSSQGTHHAA